MHAILGVFRLDARDRRVLATMLLSAGGDPDRALGRIRYEANFCRRLATAHELCRGAAWRELADRDIEWAERYDRIASHLAARMGRTDQRAGDA